MGMEIEMKMKMEMEMKMSSMHPFDAPLYGPIRCITLYTTRCITRYNPLPPHGIDTDILYHISIQCTQTGVYSDMHGCLRSNSMLDSSSIITSSSSNK